MMKVLFCIFFFDLVVMFSLLAKKLMDEAIAKFKDKNK